MRSLIILEVEHGESTDGLTDMADHLASDSDWYGDGSLIIIDYTVRVDIPVCFTLDSGERVTVTDNKDA